MPLLAPELNRVADEIVSVDGEFYIHDDDPGVAGTAHRMSGIAAQDAPASSWSNATNGDVLYNADLGFGLLSSTVERTPNYWSYVRGGTVRATGRILDDGGNHGVAVAAHSPFRIRRGTIRINGSTM